MKLTLKKMITPICIVLILVLQLVSYFLSGEVSLFVLATACVLIPSAIKDLKPGYVNSSLKNVFLIIGIIMISVGVYVEFIR